MSKNYVKVPASLTLKEAIKCMHDNHQNCVLVVDDEDLLEGILTYGDVRRLQSKSDSRFLDVCDDMLQVLSFISSILIQYLVNPKLWLLFNYTPFQPCHS